MVSSAALAQDAELGEPLPTLFVSAFRFEGNTAVDADLLQEILRPMTGQELSMFDLYVAAAAVAAHYHGLGYFLAEAVLPPQEVVDGVITIRIFEGRYGEVIVHNESALRDDVVLSVVRPLEKGDLVHQALFDKTRLILDEIPGVEVDLGFAPGSEEGTADLVVMVRDGDTVQGRFSLEVRPRGDGTLRMAPSLALILNNPAGWGDQLEASFAASAGRGTELQQGRVEYTVPMGARGKLGVGYAGARQGMKDALGVLDVRTWSNTLSVSAGFAAVKGFERNLSLSARIERADAGRSINGYKTPQERWRVTFGVDEQRLRFPGNGVGISSWSVSATASASPGTEPPQTKLNGSFTHRHLWDSGVEISGSLEGQLAFANLRSEEQMELRPAGHLGAVSGDVGWAARLELKKSWPQLAWLAGSWKGALYVETGAVQLERFPADGMPDIVQRSGLGIGLDWSLPSGHSLYLGRTWPLGAVPGEASAGETTIRYTLSF